MLRRHFRLTATRGEAEPAGPSEPVLYVMNHSSWWDGLVLYHATQKRTDRMHYVMMEEAQLQKYRFFRKLGAFSIDKSRSRGIVESLNYALSLLNRGERVWIFPQGEIVHQETRPLRLQGGAGFLLERCPRTVVVPVTVYYSWSGFQMPEATLWFGQALNGPWDRMSRGATMTRIGEALEDQLDQHRELAIETRDGHLAGFVPTYMPGSSTSDAMDAGKRRLAKWKSYFGR